jgi:nicotinamide-nucleotide amidase
MYNTNVINSIKEILLKRKQTLAVAESVTSGHLQAAFSLADGASLFFQGGITAYNLGQKARHLHVDPIVAESCNCVSDKVTEQMALHAAELFSCDWTIAITGYAAPVPEIGVKDLFAFVAFSNKGKVALAKKIIAEKQNLFDCQIFFTEQVLLEFEKLLKNNQVSSKPILSEH